MSALWSISRSLQIPLDKKITELDETPYTISYVIRKKAQIDNLMELPKDKRPTDKIIWDGKAKELEQWLERVFDTTGKKNKQVAEFIIGDVEG